MIEYESARYELEGNEVEEVNFIDGVGLEICFADGNRVVITQGYMDKGPWSSER